MPAGEKHHCIATTKGRKAGGKGSNQAHALLCKLSHQPPDTWALALQQKTYRRYVSWQLLDPAVPYFMSMFFVMEPFPCLRSFSPFIGPANAYLFGTYCPADPSQPLFWSNRLWYWQLFRWGGGLRIKKGCLLKYCLLHVEKEHVWALAQPVSPFWL